MTLTFDSKCYGDLLAKYQPKVITTEIENEQAIALARELEYRPNRTAEEEVLLELLIALISKFEDENYPIPETTSLEMLLHLMEVGNLREEDLVNVIGTPEMVSQVIKGQLKISESMALSLANFFQVDVDLFT